MAIIRVSILWFVVVVGGFLLLMGFNASPASATGAPAQWPQVSAITRTPGAPSLMLFLHPRCPCSRASLAEFSRIAVQMPHSVKLHIVFVLPPGASDEWRTTTMLADARAIPRAHITFDANGVQSKLFGAETSGHAVYFDGHGRLRFSGGITPSRGHQGESPGKSALLTLASESDAAFTCTDVFGCPLLAPEEKPAGGAS